MGKAKPKTFLGSAVRNNPTNYNVACNEEDLEHASEDDWQRISHQLQSGMIFFKYIFLLMFMFMNDNHSDKNKLWLIKLDDSKLIMYLLIEKTST